MSATWSEEDADVASFLAVVPPPSVVTTIEALQRSVGIAADVAPHVTVKSQPGLGEPARWRPAVQRAVAEVVGFELTLTEVAWFGDGIVYLAVGGPVVALHRAILDAVESVVDGPRFEYDGDGYVPHLTLAATFAGASRDQLDRLAAAAAGWTPTTFPVTEVLELRRTARGAPYRPAGGFLLST